MSEVQEKGVATSSAAPETAEFIPTSLLGRVRHWTERQENRDKAMTSLYGRRGNCPISDDRHEEG